MSCSSSAMRPTPPFTQGLAFQQSLAVCAFAVARAFFSSQVIPIMAVLAVVSSLATCVRAAPAPTDAPWQQPREHSDGSAGNEVTVLSQLHSMGSGQHRQKRTEAKPSPNNNNRRARAPVHAYGDAAPHGVRSLEACYVAGKFYDIGDSWALEVCFEAGGVTRVPCAFSSDHCMYSGVRTWSLSTTKS